MREQPANSVDAVITDPPYGLSFMGKDWDSFKATHNTASQTVSWLGAGMRMTTAAENRAFQDWNTEWLTEAFRVMKPGATLFAFGGTRTFHRLVCAAEDAGFEVRDVLMWLYATGFPKAMKLELEGWDGWKVGGIKPAYEPILWARKPCEGSTKDNVLKFGVGAFNADAGRVGIEGATKRSHQAEYPYNEDGTEDRTQHWARVGHSIEAVSAGRFPPNLLLSDEAAAMLDEQSGELSGLGGITSRQRTDGIYSDDKEKQMFNYGDNGGASRFFYVAKADNGDRGNKEDLDMPLFQTVDKGLKNIHPTVKPLELMEKVLILQEYLLKLTSTPTGGIVLDPFMGSGSTLVAAKRLGRPAIGIEKEEKYAEIAAKRLESEPVRL